MENLKKKKMLKSLSSFEKAKKSIDEDFYESPLTEEQEGEIDATEIYNEQVPSINKLMKSGEPLRKKHSMSAEEQRESDKKAWEKGEEERQKRLRGLR